MKQKNIRNFSIIAHIDHGKSTLADRIMEVTATVEERDSKDQLLDDMKVEQTHNVTVKSRTVRNIYHADDGQDYELNLIDTPGHVDFSYEVSRSLTASDGVILLVDATQGVQAQTVANYRLAKNMQLPVIPVINKVDRPNALIERTEKQMQQLDSRFKATDFIKVSAKTGQNIHELMEAIVNRIPAPQGKVAAPLKALVFDSQYDQYKGVIALVRLVDGKFTNNEELKLMANDNQFKAKDIGFFAPQMRSTKELSAGDVGYIVTGLKDPEVVRVGDTITTQNNPTSQPLAGYQPVKSMVFAGIYPKSSSYKELKDAIEKLSLNDPSFRYTEETSDALGPGFRGGFLGMFHLQIIKERLQDEYGIDVLTTAPNVSYHVYLKQPNDKPKMVVVDNPVKFPYFNDIDHVEEPFLKAEITIPSENMGEVMKLAEQYMGTLLDIANEGELIVLTYKMPLSKIAYDFFNHLKSISHGYASLNTSFLDYEESDVVKVEVDVNYAPVDALAFIVHRTEAPDLTQTLVHKLKYTIPRKLYPTPVQAIVEGKAIARIDVPPLRKNAAVNGEKRSISKKQALLRRQSVNKRKAAHSQIELPQAVFNALLELN